VRVGSRSAPSPPHLCRDGWRDWGVLCGSEGKGRPYFSGQPIEAGDHEHVAGVELIEGALIEGAAHVGAVDLGSATQASPPPGGMMVFLAVLTIGFIYECKKGALEWD
jgi:hypothetical protein